MSAVPPEWKGGRVFITGAGGFVGRHVVEIGTRLGVEMHAFGRNAPGGGVAFHAGEIEDAARVAEVVAEVAPAGVIHLAAAGVAYGQSDVNGLCRVNALGLGNVLEAASQLVSPPAVVCAGSGFEYAPLDRARRESDPLLPNSAYGASKAAAAAVASFYAARLPVTVLRPFSIYGAGEPAGRLAAYVIAKTRAGEPVDLTPGAQLRDYAEVGDVAEAFWHALAQPPPVGTLRALNVGAGEIITLRAFVEAVADALCGSGLAPDLRFGARPYRSDEMMNYTADISLLRTTLGWTPPTPLSTASPACSHETARPHHALPTPAPRRCARLAAQVHRRPRGRAARGDG